MSQSQFFKASYALEPVDTPQFTIFDLMSRVEFLERVLAQTSSDLSACRSEVVVLQERVVRSESLVKKSMKWLVGFLWQ